MDVVSTTSLDSWTDEPLEHLPRCLANGDYDRMQCIKDKCFCLDKDLKQTGSEKDRSKLRYLQCFNMNLHPEKYVKECEINLKVKLDQMKTAIKKDMLVMGFDLPECDLDGSYAPKLCVNKTCFCVNKYGDKINDTVIYEIPRFEESAKNMNCYCAREELFLREHQIRKKVSCSPGTGNYAAGQCLGSLCYCVDEEGYQITPEFHEADIDDDLQNYCQSQRDSYNSNLVG